MSRPTQELEITDTPLNLSKLDLPPDVRHILLPLPTDSVISLLQFARLAHGGSSVSTIKQDPSHWLSPDPPKTDFDITLLPKWPLPPVSLVKKLVDSVLNSRLEDNHSVIPAHLSPIQQDHRFPLWVLDYWREVYEVQRVRSMWQRAMAWMTTRCQGSLEATSLKQDILDHLHMTRRTAAMKGPGMSSMPIETLCTYLSHDWLSGLHIADQVAAMQEALLVSL